MQWGWQNEENGKHNDDGGDAIGNYDGDASREGGRGGVQSGRLLGELSTVDE